MIQEHFCYNRKCQCHIRCQDDTMVIPETTEDIVVRALPDDISDVIPEQPAFKQIIRHRELWRDGYREWYLCDVCSDELKKRKVFMPSTKI